MKREIPAALVVVAIVVVLAVVGLFYGRTWFKGPKVMSAKRPANLSNPVPPTGQFQSPRAPAPVPGAYGR